MSYFAGLGAGRGWNLFYFILLPDELPKIFEGLYFSFVGTGSRVDKDYKETSKNDYFLAYKLFFEQILIGENSYTRQESWNIEKPVRTSIIDDINKIKFEDITDENGEFMPYKRVIPLEPVINIDPFYLFWSAEQEKMSVAYLNESGIIGLRLSYPKYVSFNHSDYVETTIYETANLYSLLTRRIKEISHKAKVETPIKLFKPNFWITHNATSQINSNKYLKANNLEVL